jgi:hypothetical protein
MERSPFLVVAREIFELTVRALVADVKFPLMAVHVSADVQQARTREMLSFPMEDSRNPRTCCSVRDHALKAGLVTSVSLPSESLLMIMVPAPLFFW